jgi:CO dehydrogenase/acetyl-CoA synthase gamma subunit (corrinoid Fe-S protein)
MDAIRELEIQPETLILPGMMKEDKEQIEEALRRKITIVPIDSSQLPMLIRKSLPNL